MNFSAELLASLRDALRLRWSFTRSELLAVVDETGPRSLPIIALCCGLIGLMLAYMGGAQLGRIGAQVFVADMVTVGMTRELAGLMTAVILAGRVSAAFAAQLGAMRANEEIDALRAFGISPVAYLVLPRMLALVLVFPLLMVAGGLVGIAAAWPAAVSSYGATSDEYLQHALNSVTATHLFIGLFKGGLYAVIVAVAGCREGLRAGPTAHDVGLAATRAVVFALIWIVVAASLSTVFFTVLGY